VLQYEHLHIRATAGMQFYGETKIDAKSDAMTVALKDLTGATLWQKTLAPERG
jgi:alkaline phosphatase D